MVRYLSEMPLKLSKNYKDQFDCTLNFLEVYDLGYNMLEITHVKGFVGKNCIYYTLFIAHTNPEN